ncbi:hypothetical protein [Kitasatospora griseola]|uniref:hypothetical protein n=1 Tax=Kitasatospora griseola TaxID=2064 RepID=UPI0034397336
MPSSYSEPVTTGNHTYYVMPKPDGGFEIRPTVDGEALVTRVPGGRMVSNGALWRAAPVHWNTSCEAWDHTLYVAFGDDPREYADGQAPEGMAAEFIARRSYDDMFGFGLRSRIFPVADINPCGCRYAADHCLGCGRPWADHTAADEVWTALYGPDSL